MRNNVTLVFPYANVRAVVFSARDDINIKNIQVYTVFGNSVVLTFDYVCNVYWICRVNLVQAAGCYGKYEKFSKTNNTSSDHSRNVSSTRDRRPVDFWGLTRSWRKSRKRHPKIVFTVLHAAHFHILKRIVFLPNKFHTNSRPNNYCMVSIYSLPTKNIYLK